MNVTTPLPQLTVKAIVLGLVLSALLAGANAYLGMFAGLTVAASIPAAVISMAVLRLWRNSNILENNMVQTIASAGESLAAGVIFTIPALVLLGYWRVFDYWWVTVIAGLGGLLGVLFTIPLRRTLIVEQQLAYPEGTATAEVLKVGDAPGRGALQLAFAAVARRCRQDRRDRVAPVARHGAERDLCRQQHDRLCRHESIAGAARRRLHHRLEHRCAGVHRRRVVVVRRDPDLLDLVLGQRSRARCAVRCRQSRQPILRARSGRPRIRYLGVGAMLIGGVWALLKLRKSIWSGISTSLRATPMRDGAVLDHRDQDVPLRLVLGGIVLFVLPIAALYYAIVGTLGIALAMTIVMVLAGFLFSAVSSYMSGLVGSSNNPVSGITIATILLTSLLLLALMGPGASNGPAAAIMVGAVVCCAAAIGADTMQDLRAGYLLGATPWRQQVGQALGVVAAVLVMAPILNLLQSAYGIGARTAEQPNALLAPQANLMASVARGVFGEGLPWPMIGFGVLVGAAIIALDVYLERRRAVFRTPVLAVAIGIYLPLELVRADFRRRPRQHASRPAASPPAAKPASPAGCCSRRG